VRRQLILSVALVHAVLMSIFVLDLVERQRVFLHNEALARAESLARTLSVSSVSWALSSDLVGLEEVTRSIAEMPGLEYACILDPSGRVLSHTDSGLVGQYVADTLSLSLLRRTPELQHLLVDSRQIDVAAPVVAGSRMLGWARIGFSQSAQRSNLAHVTIDGLVYMLLAIIVGGVMALFIARRLSGGLEKLVAAVDAVRAGDRSVVADEARADEIGRLGGGFNAMLQAVREGEEKFRTVADFTYNWEYWRSPDGHLVWMSSSCELVTGFAAESFLADPDLLLQLVHPDDLALFQAHMDEVEAGSIEPGELDFRIVHRSGQVVWINHHCQDITREGGAMLGRRVCNRDITLRKHAEEGLRRWAQVFEHASWGVVVCSPHSRCMEALNPAFAGMHGYVVDELVGRPVSTVYPQDVRAMVEANFQHAHSQGHHSFETDHIRKDGSRFPAQMDVTAVKDPAGKILYRIVSVQDITERRRAQNEIFQAKEAAEAANEAKSNFLAIMSHELRTPLNGIKGMLQVLRDGLLPEEDRAVYIDHALEASDGLALVLNDVLDVTRIEAGRLILCEDRFTLEEVAGPVCSSLASTAQGKGLEFSWFLDPQLPPLLLGDPGRTRQILLNLLGNAVKFTQQGSVRLEIYPLPAQVGLDKDQVPVHFVVKDTGIGMTDEHLRHIFEPFTQVESPFTRSHGGVGLGLSIVQRLVALLKGHLEVYSEPEQGTQIHLTLPLRVPDASPPEPELFADGQQLPEAFTNLQEHRAWIRALVVEDDSLNQLTAMKYLERLGCESAAASGGAEALALLVSEHFDLVLMDIQMPDMDGITATRRIRSSDGSAFDPQIPIVALTAHAMPGDRELFLESGMNAYLAKPYSLEALQAVLAKVLARR